MHLVNTFWLCKNHISRKKTIPLGAANKRNLNFHVPVVTVSTTLLVLLLPPRPAALPLSMLPMLTTSHQNSLHTSSNWRRRQTICTIDSSSRQRLMGIKMWRKRRENSCDSQFNICAPPLLLAAAIEETETMMMAKKIPGKLWKQHRGASSRQRTDNRSDWSVHRILTVIRKGEWMR